MKEVKRKSIKSEVMTIMLGISLFCVLSIFLLTIFDKGELFENNKPSDDQREEIDYKVLEENKDYYVRGEFTGKYLDLTKRGYYIDTLNELNAPYFYIICMGEKSTGGYSLKIKEVRKNDNKTEIIVEELTPPPGSVVTQAFTYPTIIVEFPTLPENMIIKNTEGIEIPKLSDY